MSARSELLSQTDSVTYDLCIIGGGASGAGCALDAQLRGLRTILLDGSDFASRTSSASTKLAHGGVRYLQAAVADPYADGQFDDARYGFALIATFVNAGGVALNYARAVDFERARDGRIIGAAVKDGITQRMFTVRARAFVNATGPFSDAVRRLA